MDTNPYRSPVPVTSAAAPSGSRPASLIVFGILNILFGVLGLCGTAGSSAMFLVEMPRDPALPNPMLELLDSNPSYRLFLQVSIALGGLASLALLAAGIGLLLAKAWGRTLSVGYAWYAIVAAIVGMVVNWVYVLQPMLAAVKADPGPAAAGALGGAVGGMVGGLFGLAYPIVLLVFMNRAALREALARREAT